MNEKTLVITIPVGGLSTNCYIVAYPATGECIIIDPGDEPEKISRIINDKKLKPTMIINTHGHFDHTGGNAILQEEFSIPLYIHKADAEYLSEAASRLMRNVGYSSKVSKADHLLAGDEALKLGDISFKVLATPGHTRGGIALYGVGKAFTGDTLFAGDIGRADLYGGDEAALLRSIREKLLNLPDETLVYPGHGASSTIGNEKRDNPYV